MPTDNGRPMASRSDRTRQLARVLWVTLALNWTVATFKVAFGVLTRCMVITVDGVHSFSDGTSNIIGLIAIHFSRQPADENHPYGHQKYETLASAMIAFLLFVVSAGIFKEAIKGFWHPRTPQVNFFSFGVMALTLAVNLFVVWYERREGKRLQSDLLISDSWHTLTDVFVSLSVFVALAGIYWNIPRVDSLFSMLIAGVIVVTAISILKSSSDVLCDKAALDTERIDKITRSVDGVRDCHEIRTRGRVDDVYIDLHVLVDNHMTVLSAHDLSNVIEERIKKEIPGVHDVVVHIEPASHDH